MPDRENAIVIAMARQAADVTADARGRETFSFDDCGLIRFAALVAAQEREQCAKVCENYSDPQDGPDWDECIRQAEEATGIKVERHTLSIVIREVRRWLAHRQSSARGEEGGEA